MDGISRRRFLAENGMGIGSVALAWLLQEEGALGSPRKLPKDEVHYDLKPKPPQFAAQGNGHDFSFSAWRAVTCRFD